MSEASLSQGQGQLGEHIVVGAESRMRRGEVHAATIGFGRPDGCSGKIQEAKIDKGYRPVGWIRLKINGLWDGGSNGERKGSLTQMYRGRREKSTGKSPDAQWPKG
jgi:hypothetical protein